MISPYFYRLCITVIGWLYRNCFVAVVWIFFWRGVNFPSPEMPRINTAYRSFKVTLCQPLPHIRHWISRKPLEMEAWLQMTINRKRHMTYRMVTWPITSRYPPERSNSWSKYAQSPVSRKRLEIWRLRWNGTQWEVVYCQSNGHVTDDVTWPWKVKLWPQYANTLRANILKATGDAI